MIRKALILFLLSIHFASAINVYSCQKIWKWENKMGIRIKHRAVLLKTSDGEKVIHINVNCPNYGGKKDVCFDSWNGNTRGWKTDGSSVNAISGATVEEMLQKAPAGYNLLLNNCIDYQNAVMEYCKKGSSKPRSGDNCTVGNLCAGVKGIIDFFKSIGKK